jgi:hypothetical protein
MILFHFIYEDIEWNESLHALVPTRCSSYYACVYAKSRRVATAKGLIDRTVLIQATNFGDDLDFTFVWVNSSSAVCVTVRRKSKNITNVAVLWNIAPCSPCVNRRFEGLSHFNLQGWKQPVARLLHAGLLLGWFSTLIMEVILQCRNHSLRLHRNWLSGRCAPGLNVISVTRASKPLNWNANTFGVAATKTDVPAAGSEKARKIQPSCGSAAVFFVPSHGPVSRGYHNGLQVDC